MPLQTPSCFQKPDESEVNPIRILYNSKKWKYYHTITYTDYYQAYLDPYHFKASGRLPFNYDEDLRMFVLTKSFQKHRMHGETGLINFSTMENHHTIKDWFIAKEPLPLTLMYKRIVPRTIIDEYLTIDRKWLDDYAD
jgi:hypothetical protein